MISTNATTFALDRLAATYGQLNGLSDAAKPSPLAQELAEAEAAILWGHLTEAGPATAGEALALLVQVRRQLGNIAFDELEPEEAAATAESALAAMESAVTFLAEASPWPDRAALAPLMAHHFLPDS